ncbi:hypothetical protein L1987_03109 [Smallanthus sonchifolius]|uniref:Uncharacterized protein n=1 Tax=Smallanthus sonchifolius TaxID=185202 RepID=A0ACB9K9N3_9ASTR|nr:hypothetical protein L1987_03109 [Smallanthus sonchifolius]
MEVEAYFLAKDDGIVARIALAEMIFNEVDPTLKMMSGIATLTKTMVDGAHPAFIFEARKTASALRLVDKWVV